MGEYHLISRYFKTFSYLNSLKNGRVHDGGRTRNTAFHDGIDKVNDKDLIMTKIFFVMKSSKGL